MSAVVWKIHFYVSWFPFFPLLICFILLYLMNPTVRAFVSGHCCDGRVRRNVYSWKVSYLLFTLPLRTVMESDVRMNLQWLKQYRRLSPIFNTYSFLIESFIAYECCSCSLKH